MHLMGGLLFLTIAYRDLGFAWQSRLVSSIYRNQRFQMNTNSPLSTDRNQNQVANPFASNDAPPKSKNWVAIIALLLGVIVVGPFILLIGAVFSLALIASIGSQANREPNATELQGRPVSAQPAETEQEFAN